MLLHRNRMLELMKYRNITAKYLATKLRVSRQFLSQVLLGHKKLSLQRSRIIVDLFGAYDMAYAIDWDGMGIKNPFEEVAV